MGDKAKTMKVAITIRRKRGNAKIAECYYTYRDEKDITWYDGFFNRKRPEELVDLVVGLSG